METVCISHPTIGKVTGRKADGCSQFLGIKYGTLRHRFAPAERPRYDGSDLDATRFGPQVTSHPEAVDMELSFIQHRLPKPEFPGNSVIDGLTANITVPNTVPSSSSELKGLPVLVFIHGGGFTNGGNWWPQYDFARLVKLSSKIGKPIIGVTINYRVGAFGFLTSPELRSAGCQPNNGLHDQRMALQWLQKHIAGFGGNPEGITVMGESAGGVSAGLLLTSENPVAKRIACLGGCPPLLGQVPINTADTMAQRAFTMLGLNTIEPADLFQKLLELPEEDFYMKIPPTHLYIPVIDGDIIPSQFTFESFSESLDALPGKRQMEGILVCQSNFDSSIMAFSGPFARKEGIAEAFRLSARKTLHGHPAALASLLEHYSLSESAARTLSNDDAMMRILDFINDVAFTLPAIELAASSSCDSFVLSFNEPNPWDGPFKGYATHILDVAFLFQNFNQYLDEHQRQGAVNLARDIITFANHEAPCKPFNSGQRGFAQYEKGVKTYTELPWPEVAGRSSFIIQMSADKKGPGKDRLMEVFTNFMAGK